MMRGGVVLLFCCVVLRCYGGITDLTDYTLSSGNVVYQRFGAYSKDDSPFGGSNAYLSYDITFTMTTSSIIAHPNLTIGEVLSFHYLRRPFVGFGGLSVLEKRVYCCSKTLYEQNKCLHQNSLIIDSPLDRDDIFYQRLNFSDYINNAGGGGVSAQLKRYTELHHTGIWYIFIANCDTEMDIDLKITGPIEWKNPYGYLPGQILGFLPMYWIMTVIYCAILITWIVTAIRNNKNMMDLQHGIAFVILISVVENLLWACDYSSYNGNGHISDVTNVFGSLFSSAKLTLVRTLMLVVAVGYTITRPTMSQGYIIGIGVLTVLYFVGEATNQYISVSETAGVPVPSYFEFFAFGFLAIVNAAFFGWIAFELYITISKLKLEGEKHSMYLRLSILLVLSIATSLIIVMIQMFISLTDSADIHFRAWWLWESYWEFIYLLCISFVAWVWRPTENNTRYAYMELSGDEELRDREGPDNAVLDTEPDTALGQQNDQQPTVSDEGKEKRRVNDGEEDIDLDSRSVSSDEEKLKNES